MKKKDKKSDWETEGTVAEYETTFKVIRLKENVSYYFAVFAKNKAGISIPCEMSQPVTPRKEPSKQFYN